MKNYYLLCLFLSFLFLTFGCQTEKNINVQVNNSSATENSDGTQSRNRTNNSENLLENRAVEKTTPTIIFNDKSEPIYTDLTSEKCTTIESNPNEGGSYIGECKGIDGYKLEVIEGDIRQSINVIFPNGKKAELDFRSKVSSAFSSVGEKAEWRVLKNDKGEKNYGLIIRYNASENPEKPEQNTSYLVVTKITKDTACITDVVKPSKDQNITARKLADESVNKPCFSKEIN